MAENAKVVRERRRLETKMNVLPVDKYLKICVTALRSRNIPSDTCKDYSID